MGMMHRLTSYQYLFNSNSNNSHGVEVEGGDIKNKIGDNSDNSSHPIQIIRQKELGINQFANQEVRKFLLSLSYELRSMLSKGPENLLFTSIRINQKSKPKKKKKKKKRKDNPFFIHTIIYYYLL